MKDEHFFIVGAQRSGTTYLYQLCAEHPQIEMAQPVKPEPKFFITDNLFEQGLEFYKNKYFKGKPGAKIFGEKGTSYIEIEKAAQRIHKCFPLAKIIFTLRDPVERAISNYWFSVKNGFETASIGDAFYKEEERWQDYDASKVSVSPYAYLKRGRYIEYIQMYERYFPADQIHIVIHEQMVKSDQPLHDLYSFLGVEPSFIPGAFQRVINANDARPAEELDQALVKYLHEYFAEPTAALARRLELPLTEWKSYFKAEN